MKNISLMIIILLALAITVIGCSGLSAKAGHTEIDPLRGSVPESFHFSLQDEDIRNYLLMVNCATFPPDRNLEVSLLGKLADVKSEKELKIVFDHIWNENEHIRTLINQPAKKTGFSYPMAEIYYLLSAIIEPTWQREAAERMFQKHLMHLKPHQLSGYALHFYTLALLKNYKFNASIPFLKRLERFTTPLVYLQDLEVALGYAFDGKDYSTASQIMVLICQTGISDDMASANEILYRAVSIMKNANKSQLMHEALDPLIRHNHDLLNYSFAKLLREPLAHATANTSENVKKLKINVQVIKAGRNSNYMDPELNGIEESMRGILSFSSFKLTSKETLYLQSEKTGEISLPGRNVLTIRPIKIAHNMSQINVTVAKEGKTIFHTLLESANGGITTIGGPQTVDGMILLRLKTYNVE